MKKRIIVILSVIVFALVIIGLYTTFASEESTVSDSNVYDVTLYGDDNEIVIPANESKTVMYKIVNTNKGKVKYGIAYSGDDVEVKVYDNSPDYVTGYIDYGETKFVKLYVENKSTSENTVSLKTVLGYEQGGELDNANVLPSGYTLTTYAYSSAKNLVKHINSLYNLSTKTEVSNNGVSYNYAKSVSLMNDRLGGTTESLDGGNLRYYGASPDNYIYFNCSDYDNQDDSTCEKWRIIGVFDGKVKIIKNEIIGTYSYDTTPSGSGLGINQWSESVYSSDGSEYTGSDLMKLLNPGYSENTDLDADGNSITVNNSLYWNGESGTCYTGVKNATNSCDFSDKGLKNAVTQNMISDETWYLNGWDSPSVYANEMYGYERTTNVKTNASDGVVRTTSWVGKIALPYTSDYGYAVDFTQCIDKTLNSYKDSACFSNNWIRSIDNHWQMPQRKDVAHGIYATSSSGNVSYDASGYAHNVLPTLYLDSHVMIKSGTGDENKPYQIYMEEVMSPVNIVEYISDKYETATKTTVVSNGITYNYATSVSLMNDRLGGTTGALDGGNIRYYGTNPNNYIYFNCSDYNDQSDSTCERWRILGVFNGKIKIIRNENIGNYAYDYNSSATDGGYGINQWGESVYSSDSSEYSGSDLMKLLNPGYGDNTDLDVDGNSVTINNSLYWNRGNGKCYTGENYIKGTVGDCSFAENGLKDGATKDMISEETWYLGLHNTNEVRANEIYGYERTENNVTNSSDGVVKSSTWTGKVALPYPSDYAYAVDFSKCDKTLYLYKNSICKDNNWLVPIMVTIGDWLLMRYNSTVGVFALGSGYVSYDAAIYNHGVTPTLYLNSNVMINKGSGTYDNPYEIIVP